MNITLSSLKPFTLLITWALLAIVASLSTLRVQAQAQTTSSASSAPAKVQSLKPTELDDWIKQSKDLVVLDVRTPEERKTGHIDKSINVDVKSPDFKEQLAKLDRNKLYVVHCVKGLKRTTDSVAALQELGFKKIATLEGGYKAWADQGKPVVK